MILLLTWRGRKQELFWGCKKWIILDICMLNISFLIFLEVKARDHKSGWWHFPKSQGVEAPKCHPVCVVSWFFGLRTGTWVRFLKTWRTGVVFRMDVHSYGPSFKGGFFGGKTWEENSPRMALMAGFASAGFGEDWDASCFWLGAATIWGWGNLERERYKVRGKNAGATWITHETIWNYWSRWKLFSNQPAHIFVMGMDQCRVLLSLKLNCSDSHFLVKPNCHSETTNILLMVQKAG